MTSRSTFLIPVLLACFVAVPLANDAAAHPPSGIVLDKDGRIYYQLLGSEAWIVRLTPCGKRTTITPTHNGTTPADPHKLAIDKDGNLYLSGWGGLWKVSPEGKVSVVLATQEGVEALPADAKDGPAEKVKTHCFWNTPLAVDERGVLYFTNYCYEDELPTQILTVDLKGEVRIVAGGKKGHRDGKGTEAQFRDLRDAGMAVGPDGTLYLTDGGTCVRRVTPQGEVSTLAGGPEAGFADGKGAEARFRGAVGIAVGAKGDVYVADTGNRIRKITPDGSVMTIAGNGEKGDEDGPALRASFDRPTGVAVGPNGDVYILDPMARGATMRVRRLSEGRVVAVP